MLPRLNNYKIMLQLLKKKIKPKYSQYNKKTKEEETEKIFRPRFLKWGIIMSRRRKLQLLRRLIRECLKITPPRKLKPVAYEEKRIKKLVHN